MDKVSRRYIGGSIIPFDLTNRLVYFRRYLFIRNPYKGHNHDGNDLPIVMVCVPASIVLGVMQCNPCLDLLPTSSTWGVQVAFIQTIPVKPNPPHLSLGLVKNRRKTRIQSLLFPSAPQALSLHFSP